MRKTKNKYEEGRYRTPVNLPKGLTQRLIRYCSWKEKTTGLRCFRGGVIIKALTAYLNQEGGDDE